MSRRWRLGIDKGRSRISKEGMVSSRVIVRRMRVSSTRGSASTYSNDSSRSPPSTGTESAAQSPPNNPTTNSTRPPPPLPTPSHPAPLSPANHQPSACPKPPTRTSTSISTPKRLYGRSITIAFRRGRVTHTATIGGIGYQCRRFIMRVIAIVMTIGSRRMGWGHRRWQRGLCRLPGGMMIMMKGISSRTRNRGRVSMPGKEDTLKWSSPIVEPAKPTPLPNPPPTTWSSTATTTTNPNTSAQSQRTIIETPIETCLNRLPTATATTPNPPPLPSTPSTLQSIPCTPARS